MENFENMTEEQLDKILEEEEAKNRVLEKINKIRLLKEKNEELRMKNKVDEPKKASTPPHVALAKTTTPFDFSKQLKSMKRIKRKIFKQIEKRNTVTEEKVEKITLDLDLNDIPKSEAKPKKEKLPFDFTQHIVEHIYDANTRPRLKDLNVLEKIVNTLSKMYEDKRINKLSDINLKVYGIHYHYDGDDIIHMGKEFIVLNVSDVYDKITEAIPVKFSQLNDRHLDSEGMTDLHVNRFTILYI